MPQSLSLVLRLAIFLSLLPRETKERLRPPDPFQQLEAEAKVDKTFGKRPARTPGEKISRATEYLEESSKEKDDSAYRYVLYRKALASAGEAGAIDLALQALSGMATHYEVNELDLSRDLWNKIPRQMDDKRKQAAKELCQLCLKTADNRLTQKSLDFAQEALKEAKVYASEARNEWIKEDVQEKENEIEFTVKETRLYTEGLEQIKSDADNQTANLIVGRFLCLHEDRWADGLPKLKKASDKSFRMLAESESDMPTDADLQLDLAEGWLKAAESTPGRWKTYLCQRAYRWYEQAAPQAKGDRKTRSEKLAKRIDDELKKIPSRENRLWKYFSQFTSSLKVISAGYDSGNVVRITFQGKDLVNGKGERSRGLNVVVFDHGSLRLVAHFDPHGNASDAESFASTIEALPWGAFVALAVCDEATEHFTSSAQTALESIGGKIGLYNQKRRCSYYCIGFKGMAPGQAIEMLDPKKKIEFPAKPPPKK